MKASNEERARAARVIDEQRSAVLLAHEHPDGDAVGSMLGFALMLEKKGYRVQCSWPEPTRLPAKYDFLPGMMLVTEPADLLGENLVMTFDCANLERVEPFKKICSSADELINFDHHPDNTLYGTINFVEPKAAATSEIVYLLAGELGLELSFDTAVCLYTGIVTDTGRFQFSNTSATTMRIASEMIEMGVNPNRVYENIYQSDSMPYLRLIGRTIENAVYQDDIGLVYSTVTLSGLAQFGVRMEEAEDLIDCLRGLKQHRVAALLKELPDGRIRVSLRSRIDIDIGKIARKLGGGGHRVAAGYTSGADRFEEVVAELRGEIFADGRDSGR